ncbi:MAG: fused MFS/spermidine synthase, partial [Gemmatimonadota bacterium]|nr:fused MFS/spermidine synthase [Gemmatimonadota bacterium]
MIALLYLVFILSGAAGLIYESIWSRYLGLFVGHSAYAQIIVLAIFLGGMSLGAMLVGRRSERLRQPLIGYAVVELVVGVIGLFFQDAYVGVTRFAYDSLLPPLAGTGWLTIAKWSIAGALILPQSILLGTTFPLMSAGALRWVRRARGPGEEGRTLSMLYFANSLGAATGVLIAGFYLIRVAGLPGTLLAAAIINIVVALVTFAAVRVSEAYEAREIAPHEPRASAEAPLAPAENLGGVVAVEPVATVADESLLAPAPAPDRVWRLLLVVSFGTAVASFVYEIAWIRMLSLVLGSATHSFELMLSAFILGLALGALWIRGHADRFDHPVRALGYVQIAMGLAALATLPIYVQSFSWMVALLDGLDLTENGYRIFTVTRYAFCLAVMLPATFCAGMTLPLITRTLLVGGMGERAVGMVYGVNTLGAIVGVVLAGLILMPLVGLKALLIEGAVLDMALGLLLLRTATRNSTEPAAVRRGRRMLVATGVIAAAAVAAANLTISFDPLLLGSGVFRYGTLPAAGSRRTLFYQDGRTASVTAGRTPTGMFIATNGKPDASLDTVWLRKPGTTAPADRRPIGGDESTQALLPLITLAHAPHAVTAAVIGQGSG